MEDALDPSVEVSNIKVNIKLHKRIETLPELTGLSCWSLNSELLRSLTMRTSQIWTVLSVEAVHNIHSSTGENSQCVILFLWRRFSNVWNNDIIMKILINFDLDKWFNLVYYIMI
jgi:hypothetical protein